MAAVRAGGAAPDSVTKVTVTVGGDTGRTLLCPAHPISDRVVVEVETRS